MAQVDIIQMACFKKEQSKPQSEIYKLANFSGQEMEMDYDQ